MPEVAKAAKVAVGTTYLYFASKDALVNEVYRDAKERLRAALFEPALPALDPYDATAARRWFMALWARLGTFASAEPEAFRFLEMQDHSPYLDSKSKGARARDPRTAARRRQAPPRSRDGDGARLGRGDDGAALGAFVGLVKAGATRLSPRRRQGVLAGRRGLLADDRPRSIARCCSRTWTHAQRPSRQRSPMIATHSHPPSPRPASALSLDVLATLSLSELEQCYRSAKVSSTMRAADGPLVGRMLAVRKLPGGLAGAVRRWAGSPGFVWAGKTFEASSDTRGMGHNRVNLPGVLGRQNLFPFATSFGASAIDGQPTLILDYDLDVNPGYIRHVHDEIREVRAGAVPRPRDVEGRRGRPDARPVLRTRRPAVVSGDRVIAPTHVLITGAAGAIGAALSRAMRAAWPDTRLALVDRTAASLAALATELGNCSTHGVDLAELAALPKLVEAIAADGAIDGLVNCAGIMEVQPLETWRWDEAERLLAIDLLAPLRLQALVVPGMVARGRGSIINIASMAGKVPLKGCAYYGAAKSGLAMASEIARADLAPHGVRVVTVYPGPVTSSLEQGARDAYGGGGILGRLAPTGSPAKLAEAILVALAKGEARVVYPRLYGIGWTATNLSSWFALTYGPPARAPADRGETGL